MYVCLYVCLSVYMFFQSPSSNRNTKQSIYIIIIFFTNAHIKKIFNSNINNKQTTKFVLLYRYISSSIWQQSSGNQNQIWEIPWEINRYFFSRKNNGLYDCTIRINNKFTIIQLLRNYIICM